jgi:hypothetical protein
MVAFESLVESDAELAKGIVEPLTALFEKVDAMVKGDLLHVLGESGSQTALPFIEGVAAGYDDEEVKEAACEAIEKLQEGA